MKKFIEGCSEIVGNHYKRIFYRDVKNFFEYHKIKSPIEQILYTALYSLKEYRGLPDIEEQKIGNRMLFMGLVIYPQHKIGNYFIDFLVGWAGEKFQKRSKSKEIFVECDSQEWHERTEEERRYEKKRDRFIQDKGYQVYHYTGKEIMDNPFKVADEIIKKVYGQSIIDKEYFLLNQNLKFG